MPSIVIDTSILVNGEILRLVKNGLLNDHDIIIPIAVLDELQSQASQKKEQGFIGLDEISQLRKLSANAKIRISFDGNRPSFDDVRLAGVGRIDAIIKDVAKQNNATLFTSDRAQSMVARAQGIDVQYHLPKTLTENFEFLKFFDDTTMSVHLKEDLPPMAKRGLPGAFELVKINDTPLTHDYLQDIANQIVEHAKSFDSANIEISKLGAMVVQHDDYRIAITKPPFSENLEITIVHPIVRLNLDDYHVSEKLMKRFADSAEGILISGAPGSGKSTLASGLANFYHNQGKIVKTFESPRDLQVDPAITQYTKLDGSFENSADILLLVRPDYTIFDEVRRREDFEVYADLRLTGVGMVGVVHANSPIDAIQRFIGKIELGMIPSVLDTVLYVLDGKISKVYDLELKVKVPSGMAEQDLARPVIVISNFEDNNPEYEIYTFGEENVVIPVSERKKAGIEKLAEDKIRDILRRYDPNVQVEVLSASGIRVTVASHVKPAIIGRGGSNIIDLEKKLGLRIDVVERKESDSSSGFEIPFDYSESHSFIILTVDKDHTHKHVDLFVGDEIVGSARIGHKGQIKIPKRSSTARTLLDMASSKNSIKVFLKDF